MAWRCGGRRSGGGVSGRDDERVCVGRVRVWRFEVWIKADEVGTTSPDTRGRNQADAEGNRGS